MRELINLYKKLLLLILLLITAGIFYVYSSVPEQDNPTTGQIEAPEKKIEPSRGGRVLYMEATAYCYGEVTFTGTTPQEGRTVATDPTVIPLGTELIINGRPGYVAEDTGGLIRGNRLDIFMQSRKDCLQFGRQTMRVEIGGTK